MCSRKVPVAKSVKIFFKYCGLYFSVLDFSPLREDQEVICLVKSIDIPIFAPKESYYLLKLQYYNEFAIGFSIKIYTFNFKFVSTSSLKSFIIY